MEKIYKWYLQNRLNERKEKKSSKNKLPPLNLKYNDEFDYAEKHVETRDVAQQTTRPNTTSPKFSIRQSRNQSPIYFPGDKKPSISSKPKSSQLVISAKTSPDDEELKEYKEDTTLYMETLHNTEISNEDNLKNIKSISKIFEISVHIFEIWL